MALCAWEVFQNHFIDTVATQAGVPHDVGGAVDFLISDIECCVGVLFFTLINLRSRSVSVVGEMFLNQIVCVGVTLLGGPLHQPPKKKTLSIYYGDPSPCSELFQVCCRLVS